MPRFNLPILVGVSGLVVACNAVLGLEDVTLRQGTAGDGGESGGAGAAGKGSGGTRPSGGTGAEAGAAGEGAAGVPGGNGGSGGGGGSEAGGQGEGGEGNTGGCSNGTFDHDGDPSTTCESWSKCEPGQYILDEGTSESDRVCAACSSGTFSSSQDVTACADWTDCTPGTHVSEEGSATGNRECAACSGGTQSTTINQAMCLPPGACEPGTVETAPATMTEPAECDDCEVGTFCAGGSAAVEDCGDENWDHDGDPGTSCAAWTSCIAGSYMDDAGSATSDRACATCAGGSFSTTTNATSCTAWTVCTWALGGAVQAGTSTADAVCGTPTTPFRQFGTSAGDVGYAVAVDGSGNVYVTGYTNSSLGGPSAGSADGFVRKYDSGGTHTWTQQFGTSGGDHGYAVAVDGSGNVYVAGDTTGSLGGTNAGLGDGYLRKYSSDGTHLWTRQFGTSANDVGNAVAVDVSGNVYVAGHTFGPLGGTSAGQGDGYVRKYDSGGTPLWTRQFGTSGNERGYGVAVDASGNVHVAGYTDGSLGGTNAGDDDGYVRKYDSGGTHQWTQQFGTASIDEAQAVVVDASGSVYVAGNTDGSLGGASAGGNDGYVRKYNSSGSHQWTQQFGTSSTDVGNAVAADASGSVYVAGDTFGSLGGTNAGAYDGYVRKYDSGGSHQWTEQFGTSSDDSGTAVAVDARDNVYVAGDTESSLGGMYAGSTDAFVMQIPGR